MRVTTPLGPSRSATILVVENDPATRTLLKTAIDWEGHKALVAQNGADAFEICAMNLPVDVIVCDTDKPATGVLTLIEKIERLAPDARIIAFTGGDAEGRHYAKTFGVVRATPSKPCPISDFWEILERVLCDDRPGYKNA